MATKVLEKTHKQNTFAYSLTGGDGIKRKTCTVAAITNYTKKYNVDTEIVLNKTRDVVGTEAMNAGVSSDYIKYCFIWVFHPTCMCSYRQWDVLIAAWILNPALMCLKFTYLSIL